eukprot:686959-Hanusia_phi.AAC.2
MEEEVLVFGLCTINGELQITQIKNSQSIDEKFHWRGNEAKPEDRQRTKKTRTRAVVKQTNVHQDAQRNGRVEAGAELRARDCPDRPCMQKDRTRRNGW